MAFEYTGPSSSDKDRVRFTTGDTVALRHLLEDEEIEYLLETYGGVDTAMIPAVDAMIAKASQMVSWMSGAEREEAGQRAKALRRLRGELIAQGHPEPSSTQPGSHVVQFLRTDDTTTEYV